jgi:hypothetical protein
MAKLLALVDSRQVDAVIIIAKLDSLTRSVRNGATHPDRRLGEHLLARHRHNLYSFPSMWEKCSPAEFTGVEIQRTVPARRASESVFSTCRATDFFLPTASEPQGLPR